MGEFKELVNEVIIPHEEYEEFIHICSDWGLFCTTLAKYDRKKVIRLMCYLIEERSNSNHLLKRAVGRFNRLNQLTSGVLLSCKRNK